MQQCIISSSVAIYWLNIATDEEMLQGSIHAMPNSFESFVSLIDHSSDFLWVTTKECVIAALMGADDFW